MSVVSPPCHLDRSIALFAMRSGETPVLAFLRGGTLWVPYPYDGFIVVRVGYRAKPDRSP